MESWAEGLAGGLALALSCCLNPLKSCLPFRPAPSTQHEGRRQLRPCSCSPSPSASIRPEGSGSSLLIDQSLLSRLIVSPSQAWSSS